MSFRAFLLLIVLAGYSLAATPPLLPKSFGGWQKSTSTTGKNPAQADAANAALLHEFGFTDYEAATYQRDAHKLHVRAARFTDATGAFGGYSFYARPEMKGESIGDKAATNGDHVLFMRANVLVDALFEHATAMSASELRELAQELPVITGGAATLPTLPSYLPETTLIENSVRYVVGPVGLAAVGSPLPPGIVDFGRNAELAIGDYRTSLGTTKLAIVSYPTPQIALDRMRALTVSLAAPNQQSSGQQSRGVSGAITMPVSGGGEVTFRRSGPLLIFASGDISESEARALVQSVNYVAEVTWNERPPITERALIRLIAGIFVLIGIIIGIFLVAILFFGGSLVVLKRFFPGIRLPAQSEGLIQLDLKKRG
jgi:hypothetical protein